MKTNINTYDCSCSLQSDVCFGQVEITDAVLQDKTVTPTTVDQIVSSDAGYTGLSTVNIEAVSAKIDTNIKPENIKKGINILGVAGIADINTDGVNNTTVVESLDQLPSIGYSGQLYVIVDENAIYRWDETLFRYVSIARDYTEIKIMTGGTASV